MCIIIVYIGVRLLQMMAIQCLLMLDPSRAFSLMAADCAGPWSAHRASGGRVPIVPKTNIAPNSVPERPGRCGTLSGVPAHVDFHWEASRADGSDDTDSKYRRFLKQHVRCPSTLLTWTDKAGAVVGPGPRVLNR